MRREARIGWITWPRRAVRATAAFLLAFILLEPTAASFLMAGGSCRVCAAMPCCSRQGAAPCCPRMATDHARDGAPAACRLSGCGSGADGRSATLRVEPPGVLPAPAPRPDGALPISSGIRTAPCPGAVPPCLAPPVPPPRTLPA